ncbi:MAG: hypothetical protein AB7G75_33920 [Candidatus Binatia bacterium]
MRITLPEDIEHVLIEQARRQGTTPELLVLDSLRERFLPSTLSSGATAEEGTLADFLGSHIGVLHSREHIPGGARMSEDTSRTYA